MVNVEENLINHLSESLNLASCEKEVERAYSYFLEEFFGVLGYSGNGPCKTDGIFPTKYGTILQECKFYKENAKLTTSRQLSQLAQAIWYVFEYPEEEIRTIVSTSNKHFVFMILKEHQELLEDMHELYKAYRYEYSPSRVWSCPEVRERMFIAYEFKTLPFIYNITNPGYIFNEAGNPIPNIASIGRTISDQLNELVDRLKENE